MAYRDEIARLEAMHAANPEGRVFAHLAEAYRKGGELERAREVLTAGLERHPAYASAHVVLGRVLLDLREREAADGAFRRVLELDPHNMVALRARADIAHDSGNPDEALGLYRELISIDPSDEHASLRILEIESKPARPAPIPAPDAPDAAPIPPVEAPAATAVAELVDEPVASLEEPAALVDELAPAEDTVPEYGEASLPAIGEEVALEEPTTTPVEGLDLGPAVESEPIESGGGNDVDLGIGGLLEPTDLGGPAAAEGGAIQPDAVLDLGGMDGEFALPEPGPEPIGGVTDPYDLPGLDEIAADATPAAEVQLPTAPADEPAPAPAPAAHAPEPADIDSLFSTHDDGDAAALPDIGPELVTETIADLYAQQGLYERAASVYRRLLDQRPGDEGIESKLESARAAMNAAEVAIGTFAARTVAERKGPAPAEPETVEAEEAEEAEPIFMAPTPEAEQESEPLPMLEDLAADEEQPEPLPMLEVEPVAEPDSVAERAAESPGRAAPAYAEWNSPETEAQDTASVFDLPPLDAEPETALFDLPPLEPEGDDASLDLPPLDAEPAGAFGLPLLDDTTAEPPFVPAEDLGLEPIGASAGDSLASPPATQEPEELESVESAWTGGAGAAAPTDSPFGWAEPEAAPEQSTIGEYLESLLAWQPRVPAAPEVPGAPQPTVVPTPPTEPEPWRAPEPEPKPEPGPEPEPEPTPAPAPAADLGVDDIDALFGAQPKVAHEEISALFETPPPAAGDDIDALFGDLGPASESAPPKPAPLAPAPPAAQQPAPHPPAPRPPAAPPPAAAPAAQPPAPAPPGAESASAGAAGSGGAAASGAERASVEADGFDWDPFAELPVAEPAAATPAPPEPEPAPRDTPASGADDDEDIDMFRAWLQSLKR